MGVTVIKTGRPLSEVQLSDAALMREIGLLARERIVRRTLAGRSSDDTAFAPYSQGYAKTKAAALGSASPVNLQASGAMLNALVITRVTKDTVELGFSS